MLDRLSPASPLGRDLSRPLRVAIVGLGPKGMFALERLLDHAARGNPGRPIEVDAYEPHPVPGAGPVYDPGQPAHLRMNFAAGQVDMWWPGSTAVPRSARRSFVDWSSDRGTPCDPLDYPPRAEVGRYLADGLRRLLAHTPREVTVTIHPTSVGEVRRVGGGWKLRTTGGQPSPDPSPIAPYDEVLIATGHDRPSAGGLRSPSWSGQAELVPAVFPVERHLSRGRVPPGSTVAIRGFALSFIDAALTLTEGRGGRFEPSGDAEPDRSGTGETAPPQTWRLRYRPGDADVRVILPFSRTGRPMLAKPAADLALGVPGLETIAARGRRQLADLDAGVGLRGDLVPILATAARANLLAAGAGAHAAGIDAWLSGAAAGVPAAADESPVDGLRRSLDVGAGLLPPDLSWALGETWRTLYPALVACLGGNRLAPADWPSFRRLAAEFERVSFGPPPINAAKLLALVDAGRVDLSHLRGGRLVADGRSTTLSSPGGACPVDVVIDAVLCGPGAGVNTLLGRLIDDGHARVAVGRRGIDVAADGTCRAADGSRTPGLAAIGRPTEDSVIGNDTLSRTLHPLADLWARRIVERSSHARPATVLTGVAVGPG